MIRNYIILAFATVSISVACTGCANNSNEDEQQQTMAKVDAEAMGKAWDDHTVDRRPAVEDRNFTSEAVEKKIEEIAALLTGGNERISS